MINRNQADYTNFDGKTNKRITQAPGGSSSLSLGWGHDNTDYTNNHKANNQKTNPYGQQANDNYGQKYGNNNTKGNNSYDQPTGNMGYNYDKNNGNKNNYEEHNSKQQSYKNGGNNMPLGGENGYNSYNPINHNQNSQQNYPPTNKYPPQQKNDAKNLIYNEKSEPTSFYKPSSNYAQNERDTALEQQKYKVQSSRSNRSINTTNNVSQQPGDPKPCVKIHQQKNNDIFGSHYDYWKQDSSNTNKNSAQNLKKEPQFLHEKAQQFKPTDNGIFGSENNERTSVKVHNPPGGRSNFTFG